jgi:hypothetical protein
LALPLVPLKPHFKCRAFYTSYYLLDQNGQDILKMIHSLYLSHTGINDDAGPDVNLNLNFFKILKPNSVKKTEEKLESIITAIENSSNQIENHA